MSKLNSNNSVHSVNKVLGAKIDYSFKRRTFYIHPKLAKYRNAMNLDMLFSLIITRSRASVAFTRNGKYQGNKYKCFYNKYDHHYYVVYPIDDLIKDFPGQVSNTTITNLLNTLETEKIIHRNKKHGFIEIEITDPIACDDIRAYENGIEYSTEKTTTKGSSKKLLSRASQKSGSAVSNSNISNSNRYTSDTSHTETDKKKSQPENNIRKEPVNHKIEDMCLKQSIKHKVEHMHLPKSLVNALTFIAGGSEYNLSKIIGLMLKAKSNEPKYYASKHPNEFFDDNDLERLKNELTFEKNRFYENDNGKRFARKLIYIVRQAQPQHNKRGTKVNTDAYIMRGLQNYFYLAILNYDPVAKNPKDPDIPFVDLSNDNSIAE